MHPRGILQFHASTTYQQVQHSACSYELEPSITSLHLVAPVAQALNMLTSLCQRLLYLLVYIIAVNLSCHV